MEDERAFFAILLAICYISTLVFFLAREKQYIESIGFGTIIVGLIGVLRQPQRHSVTIDNKSNDPVPTTDAAS